MIYSKRNRFAVKVLVLLAASGNSIASTTCSLVAGSMSVTYLVTSASPTDQSIDLIASCTRTGGPQSVSIEVAVGPSATSNSIASRRMSSPTSSDLADYNLFRDASRTLVWGNTSGVNTLSQSLAIPNNTTRAATFTIYGRMPVGQNLTPGTYTDSVTVSVTP